MAKAAAKLFKDPVNAERAASELRAKGFKEIGILVRGQDEAARFSNLKAKEVSLPQAGSAVALGTMATALAGASGEEAAAALASFLGLSEEAIRYYDFGISVGGVLVAVHADEARLPQAREMLRQADVLVARARGEMWASSPGFASASRMTETNPLDAKMTGDFRRY